MSELERKEIIKELEGLVKFITCPEYVQKALSLIKELTEENERLMSLCTSKDIIIEDLNAENERLKENNIFLNNTISKNAQQALEVTLEEIEKAKADTVQKMQDRFNKVFGGMDATSILLRQTFDQIAKELTEKEDVVKQ